MISSSASAAPPDRVAEGRQVEAAAHAAAMQSNSGSSSSGRRREAGPALAPCDIGHCCRGPRVKHSNVTAVRDPGTPNRVRWRGPHEAPRLPPGRRRRRRRRGVRRLLDLGRRRSGGRGAGRRSSWRYALLACLLAAGELRASASCAGSTTCARSASRRCGRGDSLQVFLAGFALTITPGQAGRGGQGGAAARVAPHPDGEDRADRHRRARDRSGRAAAARAGRACSATTSTRAS